MSETIDKPGAGDQLLVRMNGAQLKMLDAYMALAGEDMSRPEALRRLMVIAVDSMVRSRPTGRRDEHVT